MKTKKMGMPMSEKQRNHSDQSDALRKLVERQNEAEQSAIEPQVERPNKIPTGTLPPRSTVHRKPPLNLTPYYYIAGVLLLLVIGGLVFLWYAARSEPSTAQPQTQSKASETGKQAPAKDGQTKTPSSPAPSPQAKPAPANPGSSQNPAGSQAQTSGSVKPPAASQTSSAKATAPQSSAAKPAPVAKKAPAKAQKRILRHRVQKGDTLYKISVMYYGTGKYQFYLARYNGIQNLYAGTVLKVPIPPR
jgi:LysM repeat protein